MAEPELRRFVETDEFLRRVSWPNYFKRDVLSWKAFKEKGPTMSWTFRDRTLHSAEALDAYHAYFSERFGQTLPAILRFTFYGLTRCIEPPLEPRHDPDEADARYGHLHCSTEAPRDRGHMELLQKLVNDGVHAGIARRYARAEPMNQDEQDLTQEQADAASPGSDLPTEGIHAEFTLEQNTPCAGCGYNLRGLSTSGTCPECATPITISLPGKPNFVKKPDVDGPLQQEIPCVQCGTLLRMQTTHGSCPTCFAPVWYSIYGTWLRTSDPGWLTRVRTGMTLWLWVVAGGIIFGCLGGIVTTVWTIKSGATNPGDANIFGLLMASVLGVLGGAANVLIAWYITTPNPATAHLQRSNNLRSAILGGYALGVVGSAGFVLIEALDLPLWVSAIPALLGLGTVFATVGLIYCLRCLADRVPNPRLVRSATVVMWGLGLSQGSMQVLSIVFAPFLDVSPFGSAGSGAPSVMAFSFSIGLFALVGLVFVIWSIVLLVGIRSALSQAIEQVTADRAAA